jgi:hypothetical protein
LHFENVLFFLVSEEFLQRILKLTDLREMTAFQFATLNQSADAIRSAYFFRIFFCRARGFVCDSFVLFAYLYFWEIPGIEFRSNHLKSDDTRVVNIPRIDFSNLIFWRHGLKQFFSIFDGVTLTLYSPKYRPYDKLE